MVRIFFACLTLLFFSSCNPEDNDPSEGNVDDEDTNDLALGFELILEGSNFDELCGVVQIDSTENSYHMYLERNACTGKVKRDGEIIITLTKGKAWKDQQAEMQITYIDYIFEKEGQSSESNKKIFVKREVNGTERIINVSGGTMDDFLTEKTHYIERKIISNNMIVNYNGNASAVRYNEVSTKEIRRDGNGERIIYTGDTVINNYENVKEWGTDANNQRFYNIMAQPIVKTLCGARWIITDGKKVKYGATQTRQNIYGLNQSGEMDGTCTSYGFKVITETPDGQIEEKVYRY